jgi:hypothetical protein
MAIDFAERPVFHSFTLKTSIHDENVCRSLVALVLDAGRVGFACDICCNTLGGSTRWFNADVAHDRWRRFGRRYAAGCTMVLATGRDPSSGQRDAAMRLLADHPDSDGNDNYRLFVHAAFAID